MAKSSESSGEAHLTAFTKIRIQVLISTECKRETYCKPPIPLRGEHFWLKYVSSFKFANVCHKVIRHSGILNTLKISLQQENSQKRSANECRTFVTLKTNPGELWPEWDIRCLRKHSQLLSNWFCLGVGRMCHFGTNRNKNVDFSWKTFTLVACNRQKGNLSVNTSEKQLFKHFALFNSGVTYLVLMRCLESEVSVLLNQYWDCLTALCNACAGDKQWGAQSYCQNSSSRTQFHTIFDTAE